MLPGPDENANPRPKSFVVQYHVRGRRKRKPLMTRCETVQDVIEIGQRSFPAFSERNPWICIDSKHATVFVGLDPEIQSSKRAVGDGATARNISKIQESTER
jgi:hypothetical protein